MGDEILSERGLVSLEISTMELIVKTLPEGRRDKASANMLFLPFSYKRSTLNSLKIEIQRMYLSLEGILDLK